MRTLVFLISALLMSQRFSSIGAQCLCQQTSCNCSRLNLHKVPAAPSELVAELDLSHNRLQEVTQNDFGAFSTLRSLMMNNNRIRTIHEDAFVFLLHLEKLDLSENEFSTLSPQWFKSLSSLQHLNLLGNKYTRLGRGNLFQPLQSLKSLHVGGAFLQSVGGNDFSGLFGLEELFFDGKNLQHYAEGSLSQIGPVSRVTLGLNDMIHRNPKRVGVILTDIVHPNTTFIFTDTNFSTSGQMKSVRKAFDFSTSVTFKKVNILVPACQTLLFLLSNSNITMLAFEDMQFLENLGDVWIQKYPNNLKAVFFKNIVVDWIRFPALSFLGSLLNVVQRVSILNANLFAIPCLTSVELMNLEFFDISDNLLGDDFLSEMMCNGRGVLWNLKTLNISSNNLQTINSELFTKLPELRHVDLSRNRLQNMPATCHWPASLRFLNLSSCHQTKVTRCLPESLQILDLSRNELTVFNVELPSLVELHISGNKIGRLPDGSSYPRLKFLSIHTNNLQTLSSGGLNAYKELERLEAHGKSYVCSCDLVGFVSKDLLSHGVRVEDDLNSYICDSPDAARHRSVPDVRLSVFDCHAAWAFSLLCSGILALLSLSVGLCYKFSVIWYMRMTCAWLRAKRKPKLKKGILEYDAFVSYSEMDSNWVEDHLVPALEQSEPPLRLCLHKRDFVPGGLIQDNIMDAMEKSHKSLFILTEHFVKSEWCRYELDYSHFRLFDQKDDTVVLILLEPIDKDKIPKRFCRLRSFMNSRTYLEWPEDDDHIPLFWEKLRAAVVSPDVNERHKVTKL